MKQLVYCDTNRFCNIGLYKLLDLLTCLLYTLSNSCMHRHMRLVWVRFQTYHFVEVDT